MDKNVTNKHVYIGVGKEGLTHTKVPRVIDVDANLLVEKKATKRKIVKVYFENLHEEKHATIMHQAFFNALKILHPAISTQKKNEKNPLY